MTAQIVVMNGYGVAISSDSAVSLGSIRTFETAEKIYPLLTPHRIAVMHCGSVNFGGIPYPVLIAEWKRQMPTKPLRDPEAYKENFIDWLEHHGEWFSDVRHENQFMWFLESRLKRISEMMSEYKEAGEEFNFSELLANWIKECQDAGSWEGIDSQDVSNLFISFATQIKEKIDSIIDITELINNEYELFQQYISICYTSKILEGSEFISNAGLLFIGYGENEILPGYFQVDIAGVLKNKVAFADGDSHKVETSQQNLFGMIMPAQRDAMDLFLRGYDWELAQKLIEAASSQFKNVMTQIRDINAKSNQDLEDFLDSAISKFEDDLDESRSEISENDFLRDLRRSLSSLPLASLAYVAKALVEIQGLRQTTSAQFNSVGGPTDVAIIEPLEGFQWVHHKSI